MLYVEEGFFVAKKVIDRILYDTEKAEEIFSWENHYSRMDFDFVAEVLYRTPKGNFFLVGEGGPMSKYAVPAGSNATSGSSDNITPISKEQAITWLENHEGDEKILELFPEEIEEG
jgi:hypothetical protein